MKDVIESCIRPRKEDRPKVKDLLSHPFFEEDVGLKVEVVSRDNDKIVFRLRVIDPKKRTHKHKENEAIQFEFDIATDKYDAIAEEMVIILACLASYFQVIKLSKSLDNSVIFFRQNQA